MSEPVVFLDGRVTLYQGDCRNVLASLPDESVDSVVTDPPYGLEFMGKDWDSFETYSGGNPNMKPQGATIKAVGDGYGYRQKNPRCRRCGKLSRGNGSCKCPEPRWDTRQSESAFQFQVFCEEWAAEVYRVLKPGGHLVAFSGTRTYHRMTVAIEDGGFEIRDQIGWAFGSGFPKSHDVSKGIDRAAGAERIKVLVPTKNGNLPEMAGEIALGATGFTDISQPVTDEAARWQGWGTALKPAWEPICLARKPLIGTVAENVLAHGTGAINIDACRVDAPEGLTSGGNKTSSPLHMDREAGVNRVSRRAEGHSLGRWPANLVHDGSEEVLAAFPETGISSGGRVSNSKMFAMRAQPVIDTGFGDDGSAARFFYSAKADADDRIGSKHPTVKPVDLMRWLCRLITPPGGTILDPFAGTGTTGEAAFYEGFNAILIEREPEYQADIERRMRLCMAGPDERKRESIKAKMADKPIDAGPLFGDAA